MTRYLCCALALLAAAGARAQIETTIQPSGDLNWTATAGRTVGDGNQVIQAEAGWPGIGVTYLKGMDERTDVGLHVGLNYGFENTTSSVAGMNIAVPFRRVIGQSGAATIAFRTDPGLSFYGNSGLLFGVGGPVGVVAGMRFDPRLTVDVGADVPVLVSFSNPAGLVFGPMVGAGAEYLFDKDLAITLRARVGPEFAIDSAGTGSTMGVQTLLGVAYNMR